MPSIQSIALWPTVVLVLVATATDLRTRRIPNWLALPFLATGLAASGISGGWSGLWQSLLGVLAAVLVMGPFCYLGGMGKGDLKLCAAVGAWIGPSQLFLALITTGLAGGVMAICWAVAGGFMNDALRSTASLLFPRNSKEAGAHGALTLDNPLTRKMPYAPAIAVGTILSFLGRQV